MFTTCFTDIITVYCRILVFTNYYISWAFEYGNVFYTDRLDETGHSPDNGCIGYGETLSTRKNKDGSWKYPSDPQSLDLEMKNGMYLINSCPVIFHTI